MRVMRPVSITMLGVLALFSPCAACGGRTVTKASAQKLLVSLPSGVFDQKDLEILAVRQTGGRNAIIETTVRAAFKIEKVQGSWAVREVKVGNHGWVKIEDIAAALLRVQTEDTRALLEEVAASLDRYRKKNGRLPAFADYVTLSDALYPDHQSRIIRFDAWQQPLVASLQGVDTVRLASVGPDSKPGTADDIVVIRAYPR